MDGKPPSISAKVGLAAAARKAVRRLVGISNEADFKQAIGNDVTIELLGDITLTPVGCNSAIAISCITGLVIKGNGYTIGFASSDSENGRCFEIASGSEVTFIDVTACHYGKPVR